MEIELGHQPGHSENYKIIARFLTEEQAHIAYLSLADLLDQTQKRIPDAILEAEDKLSKKHAEEFAEEIKKRFEKWAELFETDWEDGGYISLEDNEVAFSAYSGGRGIDEVENFLIEMGGEIFDDKHGNMTDPESVMEQFRLSINNKLAKKKIP
jgi:hypothetical protein